MNIAIIDDLKEDREKVEFYLHKYFAKHTPPSALNIDHYKNGETFIKGFVPYTYQIIFIDYYMDQMSGVELAIAIRKSDSSSALIFTTVSQEYAIVGYKVKASGYLVKPFAYEELVELISLLEMEELYHQEYIEIVNGCSTQHILLESIVYCDIAGHYIQLHLCDGNMERTRMTFSQVSRLLDPYTQFLCCYRGCVVNMDHIKSLDDYCFIMLNSERIPIRLKEYSKISQTYFDYVFKKTRKKNRWKPI